MKPSKHIQDELKEITPALSQIERLYFPAVPAGYLENFPTKMVELVEAEAKPINLPEYVLQKLQQQKSREVPSGYFNQFSAQMLQKVQATELAEIAPTLATLKSKEQIEVPAGYFVGFPAIMQKQIAGSPAIPSWLQSLNNVLDNIAAAIFKPQYAMAYAGVTAVLVVGMFYFFTPPQSACKQGDLLCQLEKIDTKTLDAYMLSHADEFGESVLEISINETEILNQQPFDASMLQELTEDELKTLVD